jgi:hypothetical protein
MSYRYWNYPRLHPYQGNPVHNWRPNKRSKVLFPLVELERPWRSSSKHSLSIVLIFFSESTSLSSRGTISSSCQTLLALCRFQAVVWPGDQLPEPAARFARTIRQSQRGKSKVGRTTRASITRGGNFLSLVWYLLSTGRSFCLPSPRNRISGKPRAFAQDSIPSYFHVQ